MIVKIPKTAENTRVLMQRLGYNEHKYKESIEPNYTRRLAASRYPRLHAYIEEKSDGILLKLHLDMQESKAYGRKHGGVYEHELLDREAGRIKKYVLIQQAQEEIEYKQKKSGFWERLFG